eukprot:scaffold106196_cov69-Phaeocystis_antarctica.AAC.1
MSVLCSGGSLGSKPASFLILAMASFSDLASTTSTTRSEMINRLEGSMLKIVEGALADRRVEQITVVYSCNSKSPAAASAHQLKVCVYIFPFTANRINSKRCAMPYNAHPPRTHRCHVQGNNVRTGASAQSGSAPGKEPGRKLVQLQLRPCAPKESRPWVGGGVGRISSRGGRSWRRATRRAAATFA